MVRGENPDFPKSKSSKIQLIIQTWFIAQTFCKQHATQVKQTKTRVIVYSYIETGEINGIKINELEGSCHSAHETWLKNNWTWD